MPSKPIGPAISSPKSGISTATPKTAKSAPSAAPSVASQPAVPDVVPGHEEESEAPFSPSLESSSKRRMPDNLRRFLLRVQGGKFYLPAAYRVVWFRDECPDWGVSTQLIEGGHEAGSATVQGTVMNPESTITD